MLPAFLFQIHPTKALAALVSPPVECDVVVSSAAKKAIAQPGSCVPTMLQLRTTFGSDLLHTTRRMMERARALYSALLCDVGGDAGSLGEGVPCELAVVVQFERAAGCDATSCLFEMWGGGRKVKYETNDVTRLINSNSFL
jgi:hypothetical protein